MAAPDDRRDSPPTSQQSVLAPLPPKAIRDLGKFFGGQGTANVPCWSPDGRKVAFVTYQLIP